MPKCSTCARADRIACRSTGPNVGGTAYSSTAGHCVSSCLAACENVTPGFSLPTMWLAPGRRSLRAGDHVSYGVKKSMLECACKPLKPSGITPMIRSSAPSTRSTFPIAAGSRLNIRSHNR